MQQSKSVLSYIKEYKAVIILIPILILVSYGYLTLCGNVRVDLEIFLNNPGTTMGWEGIGRVGMVYLEVFFKLYEYNRVYFFVVFYVFYTLSIELLMFFCYTIFGNNKLPLWIFAILLSTSNIMMFQFYFTIQQGEIAVAFFIITISAFLSVWAIRSRITWYKLIVFIGMVFPVGLCMATYQAFVPYYVSLCLLFLILSFHNKEKYSSNIFVSDGLLLVQFFIALIVYKRMTDPFLSSYYLTDSIEWKIKPISECIFNIVIGSIKEIVGWNYSRFSFYIVDVVLIFIIIRLFIRRKSKINKEVVIKALHIFALMITPFMLNVYLGTEARIRALFSLTLVAAFMGMYLIYIIKDEFSVEKRILRYIPIIVASIQILMCIQLTYTDNIRYKQDKEFANMLYADIVEQTEDSLKNIVYMGKRECELNPLCKKVDVFGESMFEHDASDFSMGGVSRRIQGFMQSQGFYTIFCLPIPMEFFENFEEFGKNMPTYPNPGSIVEFEDSIIIKLSSPWF